MQDCAEDNAENEIRHMQEAACNVFSAHNTPSTTSHQTGNQKRLWPLLGITGKQLAILELDQGWLLAVMRLLLQQSNGTSQNIHKLGLIFVSGVTVCLLDLTHFNSLAITFSMSALIDSGMERFITSRDRLSIRKG